MKNRLETVQRKITRAAQSCGRAPESVRLVAVSKTFGADTVRRAIVAGVHILGENYIQESREKIGALTEFAVQWHFIGHLQSNKAKYAVKLFDLIHSVDSLKLAAALNKAAAKLDKTQEILIQVNISREATKSGTTEDEVQDLIVQVSKLKHLAVKGLMTMPPFFDDPARARPYFAALRHIRDQIRECNIPGVGLDELSMGMSGDFEAAIQEGSTLVRVGTAIFGTRR